MQDFFEHGAIGEIALHELRLGRDHGAVPVAEVVVNDDLMSAVEQQLGDRAPYVSGTAGNYDSQWKSLLERACLRI
jgi:hypothetical protein